MINQPEDPDEMDDIDWRLAESILQLRDTRSKAEERINDIAEEAKQRLEEGVERTMRRGDAAAEYLKRTITGNAEAIASPFAPQVANPAAGRSKAARAEFVYERLMKLDGKGHFPINPVGAFEAADALKKWPENPSDLKMVGEYIDHVAETPPEKKFKDRVKRTPVKQGR